MAEDTAAVAHPIMVDRSAVGGCKFQIIARSMRFYKGNVRSPRLSRAQLQSPIVFASCSLPNGALLRYLGPRPDPNRVA